MNEFAHALEDMRRAARARGRAEIGAFMTEGQRLLQRGVRAGWRPRRVLVADSLVNDAELAPLLAEVAARGCECLTLPDRALLEISDQRNSGLCSALFELPVSAPLDEWLAALPRRSLMLGLVDIDEPGNVGALLRTALACGAAGAICVGRSDPFHPKAVRASLGSLFKLPLVRVASVEELLVQLARHDVHSLATVARGGEPLERAHWPDGALALLMGNEAQGLTDSVVSAAGGRVRIDLSEAVDSFSVNAAAAICLYEIQRRRAVTMAGLLP